MCWQRAALEEQHGNGCACLMSDCTLCAWTDPMHTDTDLAHSLLPGGPRGPSKRSGPEHPCPRLERWLDAAPNAANLH